MHILPRIDQEFKDLIPPLTTGERELLEQNILAKKKCYDPIVLWEGIIVDGHNRYEICATHGIEFEIVEKQFASREEAKLWILNNQLSRRNLCAAMRIEVALAREGILREKARGNQSLGGKMRKKGEKLLSESSKPKATSIDVRKAIANDANVSEGNVYNYLQIKEQASPELLSQVQAGNIKIGTAHRKLPSQISTRLRRANKMYKFIEDSLPTQYRTQEIADKLQELSVKLQRALDVLEKKRPL